MKLLVISDTHRVLHRVYKVIEDIKNQIDGIIHCGDVVEDVDLLINRYSNLKFYNVKGNCDYGTGVTSEKVFVIGGKRIFVTHGHNYSVNYGIDRLCYRAMELEADACLYGHTHIPLIEKYNNILVMNPGSLVLPRGNSKPSYGILKIEENVSGSIVEYRGV